MGLWGVATGEACGQAFPSSPLSEEHTFCANLGAARSSSSSEGLARAPGLSSEASLESNEVTCPPFPVSWGCHAAPWR